MVAGSDEFATLGTTMSVLIRAKSRTVRWQKGWLSDGWVECEE